MSKATAALEWSKVLVPLIVALAVFFATGLFYYWQVRLAKQKLRHDLYDRRFAIYTAFQKLLLALVEADDDEIKALFRKAAVARSAAPFLINDSLIEAYLDSLLAAVTKDVVANINYRQSVNLTTLSPEIVPDYLARMSRLGEAKPELAHRHLPELSRHIARVLRLTDGDETPDESVPPRRAQIRFNIRRFQARPSVSVYMLVWQIDVDLRFHRPNLRRP